VQRQHVLDDELRWIAMLSVLVLLNVKADNVKAFGEQTIRPAAKAAIEVDRQRFCQRHEFAPFEDGRRSALSSAVIRLSPLK